MNPPPAINYLIGNPLVLLFCGGLALVLGVQAANGAGSWVPSILFGVVTFWGVKAREVVLEYRAWKRKWDSYGDQAPAKQGGGKFVLIGAAILLGLFFVSQASAETRGAVIVIAVVVLIGWGLKRLLRKARNRKPIASKRESVVELCLPPAQPHPNDLSAAYAALPPYCQALLTRPPR